MGHALVLHFAFGGTEERRIWVDDPDAPRSVAVHHPAAGRLALASDDPGSLVTLLEALPEGEYRLSAVDLGLVPTLERVLEVEMRTPVWLFRLREEDFRPTTVCDTEPVRAEDARLIARTWAPDRDALDYVQSRIEGGTTAGVYVDRKLVAWDLTHFETDRVAMLGFLHVLEPYRGRGYAKTVTTANCRAVFAKGKIPACHVHVDNEPSLGLTEGLGFRKVRQQAWGRAVKG